MEKPNAQAELDSTRAKRQEPEAFDSDLEWLLTAGDSALGARGTLGGVIAQLEHGGPFTGVPETDLYSDQQLGLGKTTIGLVEKHRWLSAAWFTLTIECRNRLCLCYQAPRAFHRGDALTGSRSGTDAQLGRYAALALVLCDSPQALQDACLQPQKGKHSRVIARAVKKARDSAIADHQAWAKAKQEAGSPRKRSERVATIAAVGRGDEE